MLLSRTQKLEGLTSKIGDNCHMILWDFDEADFEQVTDALKSIQFRYNLSDIFIYSDAPFSYRALCAYPVNFRTLIRIMSETNFIDLDFIKQSIRMQNACIRTSRKYARAQLKLVEVLESYPLPFSEKLIKRSYNTPLEKGAGIFID